MAWALSADLLGSTTRADRSMYHARDCGCRSGAAPKTGGGTAAPDQDAQVTHDSQPPAESAAADSQQLAEGATDDSQPPADGATHDSPPLASTGDHGPQQQITSTGSTVQPGAAPKTGGGTVVANDGKVVH